MGQVKVDGQSGLSSKVNGLKIKKFESYGPSFFPITLTHGHPIWFKRPFIIVFDRPAWLESVGFHHFGSFTLKLTQAVWFFYQTVHLQPLKIKTVEESVRFYNETVKINRVWNSIVTFQIVPFRSTIQLKYSRDDSHLMTLWIDDVTGRKT